VLKRVIGSCAHLTVLKRVIGSCAHLTVLKWVIGSCANRIFDDSTEGSMRPTILGLAFAAALLIALPIVSSSQGTPPPGGPPSGPPGAPPSGPPPGGPGGMPPRTPAQMAPMRDTVTNMMLARIVCKETATAESVFKNVQV